ncbi:MAG: tRNA (adenosine(37)-N6)-dimethylallyltransferase MiaA [Chloroflexota bacterium]|nr:tRNA (adenosine(37)-N6)-dimethylallyltransferase MiaA [Chloroflexota bacterium]
MVQSPEVATSTPPHPPVIAIFGATGVGKTCAAIHLALTFNGEIVNADSRYMYRHLQIGVAKPTLEERQRVRHHLIDLYDPDRAITIAEVQTLAYEAIDTIHAEDKLPILVGGSPLYMNAITEGWSMPNVEPDWAFREAMEREAADRGHDWLLDQVRAIDPIVAERSAANARRLIRALEVYRTTGTPMSDLESRTPPPYHFLNIALHLPREAHYPLLDRRIDEQIADGWIDEVRTLADMGYGENDPGFTSIGYRQLIEHIRGEIDLTTAIELIRQATRRYVRHQTTWLRRRGDLEWFDTSEEGWLERLENRVRQYLAQISTV